MILTCPNCGTQYVVKDGAIPAQGRQVRCASCKHSWHQDPEAAPFEDDQETLAEATMIDPSSGPEAEERAYEEALVEEAVADAGGADEAVAEAPAPVVEPAEAAATEPVGAEDRIPLEIQDYDAPPQSEPQPDDDFSPFAERDYAEPRRRSRLVGWLVVLVAVAALVAAFWFLAPSEWKARLGIADSGTTPLTLVLTHTDRQPLASGNELLTVTGRVINPTAKDHRVPPIYAQIKRRATGQVIYAWTIQPPAPSLKPGASASFNSTEVNVPSGGDELAVSLGAPKA